MPEKLERCVTRVLGDLKKKHPTDDEQKLKSRAYAICNAAMKGGGMEYGYVVRFGEDVPTAIQALKIGSYQHPVYGDFEITTDTLQRLADSVNNKVRGIDLAIDYAHKMDDKAAGWVKSAEVRDDSLWLNVEWTEPATEAIKNREYRYFSPALMDEWEDSEGNKHEDVLMGGGLTNVPWFKNLAPLNFSEFYSERGVSRKYEYQIRDDVKIYVDLTEPVEDTITFRDIPQSEREKHPAGDFAGKARSFPIFKCEDAAAAARSLGRAGPENYDSATLKRNIISIAKRKGFTACLPKAWKEMMEEEEVTMDPKRFAEILGLAEEADEDKIYAEIESLKKFRDERQSEEDKARKFAEEFPEEAKRLSELETTNRLNDTTMRLTEWKRNGLPPAVADQVQEFRMGLSDAEKFDEILATILDKGIVKLGGERGGTTDPTDKEAVKAFEEAINKLMSEDKDLEYVDAVARAERENPALAKAYLRS